jgi:hypothetical protein
VAGVLLDLASPFAHATPKQHDNHTDTGVQYNTTKRARY